MDIIATGGTNGDLDMVSMELMNIHPIATLIMERMDITITIITHHITTQTTIGQIGITEITEIEITHMASEIITTAQLEDFPIHIQKETVQAVAEEIALQPTE